ncbi:MAG: hypothetical protein GPJ54_10590 [Candidatus Heimdallarchaeota archaeon]|nr:hypothetical protein [Candidatus Heimdallarchaeota archaeon]
MNILPQWNPINYQRKLILPLIFQSLALFFLFLAISSFLDSAGLVQLFNLITSVMFVIYIAGRIYGEINAHKDFINISKQGIDYRETPGVAQGWLPVSRLLAFDQVKSIDVIKIKNLFNPESENMAIYMLPVSGKAKVIGSKLDNDQIMKVGFALKGSVAISNTLQRFLGEDSQVKDAIDTAKQMWNSFKSKEN